MKLFCTSIAFLFACSYTCDVHAQPVQSKDIKVVRYFIAAPKDTNQQLNFSLPDTSFNKLIDSCSIIFKIKNASTNEVVHSVLFRPKNRVKLVTLPENLLSDSYKMYYDIYWVPSELLKEPANIALLNTDEQRSFKNLSQKVKKLQEANPSQDPFTTGVLFSEEYHYINCSINTQPQGAEVYLVPRYEWDFRLKLSNIHSDEQINAAIINKLRSNGNYQVPRNTQLKNYGLPEISYVIVLVYNGRYKLVEGFTPSAKNPQNNIVEKTF